MTKDPEAAPMTEREKLIEAMARTLCGQAESKCDCRATDSCEFEREAAEAILAAIDAHGAAIVPKRPTADMISAYWRRADDNDEDVVSGLRRAIAASPYKGS